MEQFKDSVWTLGLLSRCRGRIWQLYTAENDIYILILRASSSHFNIHRRSRVFRFSKAT